MEVIFSILITNSSSYVRARLSLCNRWLATHTVEVSLARNLENVPVYEDTLINRYLGVLPMRECDRKRLVTQAYTSQGICTSAMVWSRDYHLRQRLQPKLGVDIELFIHGDIELIQLIIASHNISFGISQEYIACIAVLFVRGYNNVADTMMNNMSKVDIVSRLKQDAMAALYTYMRVASVPYIEMVLRGSKTDRDKIITDTQRIVECINARPIDDSRDITASELYAAVCSGNIDYITAMLLRAPTIANLNWVLLSWLTGIISQQVFDVMVKHSRRHVREVIADVLYDIIEYCGDVVVMRYTDYLGWMRTGCVYVSAGKYIDTYMQLLGSCDCVGDIFPYMPPEPLYTLTWQAYCTSGQTISQYNLTDTLKIATGSSTEEFNRAIKLVQYEQQRGRSTSQILDVYYGGLSCAAKQKNISVVRRLYEEINKLIVDV